MFQGASLNHRLNWMQPDLLDDSTPSAEHPFRDFLQTSAWFAIKVRHYLHRKKHK